MRRNSPNRTCTKNFNDYRKYKKDLAKDFNNACGYCGDSHIYFGCTNGFHIDHFKPKSKFPDLANEYSNLVYSCPFCNISKSDDWNGFMYEDPVSPNYDSHFKRYKDGRIIPVTKTGKYMYEKLKMFIVRHQILWLIEEIESLQLEISNLNNNKYSKDISDILSRSIVASNKIKELL